MKRLFATLWRYHMAFPVLNVFVNTTFPITNDCVQQMVDDAEVITLGIGTGVALSFELFGARGV